LTFDRSRVFLARDSCCKERPGIPCDGRAVVRSSSGPAVNLCLLKSRFRRNLHTWLVKGSNRRIAYLGISEEQVTAESPAESVWLGFARQFHSFAASQAKPKPLNVWDESPGDDKDKYGSWIFPPPLRILDRFIEIAANAGTSLGVTEGGTPLAFWLSWLSVYLWRHDPRRLRIRNLDSTDGYLTHREIDNVIEASEDFSTWLSLSPTNVFGAVTLAASESLPWQHTPVLEQPANETSSSANGDVWAAGKNREREERTRIVQALVDLRVSHDEWPVFIRTWQAQALTDPKYSHQQFPTPFQPPAYDRLGSQSLHEWKRAVDKAWAVHRDDFIARCQYWENKGVDETLPSLPKHRGPGRGGRNAAVNERYAWAALRLLGKYWKEIGTGTSTVKKAASRVLQSARWPTDLRAIKSPGGQRHPHNPSD